MRLKTQLWVAACILIAIGSFVVGSWTGHTSAQEMRDVERGKRLAKRCRTVRNSWLVVKSDLESLILRHDAVARIGTAGSGLTLEDLAMCSDGSFDWSQLIHCRATDNYACIDELSARAMGAMVEYRSIADE